VAVSVMSRRSSACDYNRHDRFGSFAGCVTPALRLRTARLRDVCGRSSIPPPAANARRRGSRCIGQNLHGFCSVGIVSARLSAERRSPASPGIARRDFQRDPVHHQLLLEFRLFDPLLDQRGAGVVQAEDIEVAALKGRFIRAHDALQAVDALRAGGELLVGRVDVFRRVAMSARAVNTRAANSSNSFCRVAASLAIAP